MTIRFLSLWTALGRLTVTAALIISQLPGPSFSRRHPSTIEWEPGIMHVQTLSLRGFGWEGKARVQGSRTLVLAMNDVQEPDVHTTAVMLYRHTIPDLLGSSLSGKMIAIGGPSGGLKSTLAGTLWNFYNYDKHPVSRRGFDDLMIPRDVRLAVKKRLANKPLSELEQEWLRQYGWNDLKPGALWLDEYLFWDNDEIERVLREVQAFLNSPGDPEEIGTFTFKKYGNTPSDITYKSFDLKRKTILLVEFKFANSARFKELFDLPIELQDDPARVRERFMKREREKLWDRPHELKLLEPFYDLALWPSWLWHVASSGERGIIQITERVFRATRRRNTEFGIEIRTESIYMTILMSIPLVRAFVGIIVIPILNERAIHRRFPFSMDEQMMRAYNIYDVFDPSTGDWRTKTSLDFLLLFNAREKIDTAYAEAYEAVGFKTFATVYAIMVLMIHHADQFWQGFLRRHWDAIPHPDRQIINAQS